MSEQQRQQRQQQQGNNMSNEDKAKDSSSGDPLPLNLMKSLRRKTNSESGSSNGGNNSDNSALISLGNTSFGFNFDSEENGSEERNDTQSDDSDGNGPPDSKVHPVTSSSESGGSNSGISGPQHLARQNLKAQPVSTPSMSSLTSSTPDGVMSSAAHRQAAANAVANLQSIANSVSMSSGAASDGKPMARPTERKRKAERSSDGGDSGGYDSDDERGDNERNPNEMKSSDSGLRGPSSSCGGGSVDTESNDGDHTGGGRKKKKKLNEGKREERNAREKERSFRISKQIDELRALLSTGGVIVPKGTKSSVLVEAANYIRMLQQHQYRSEIDRHQLVQQMQVIGGGAHGPKAATAIRHVAAQNGVWSLGNFGGVPPKSAMTFCQPKQLQDPADEPTSQDAMQPAKVDAHEYRFVFNSCGVGMAIASMGGAFIDCNPLFCQLSDYTKQEVCALTVFNLTARQDLQQAFDLISEMISPPMDARTQEEPSKNIVLRGALKNRVDLGLSISLVKGEDGISKCFCVTLVKSPASPFDTSKPTPVSFEAVEQKSATAVGTTSKKNTDSMNHTPAFTSG